MENETSGASEERRGKNVLRNLHDEKQE